MKKIIVGIALSLVLAISSLSMYAMAADQHTHNVGENSVTFEPWSSLDALPLEAGNYYLTGDVELTEQWTVPTGTTNLCLNGHVIKQTTEKVRVIYVPANVTLNLCDCDTKTVHYFTKADRSEPWALAENQATPTEYSVIGGCITGGCIENTTKSQQGGGGILVGGTLNMYGGNIAGNSVVENYGSGSARTIGGGVYVNGGKFTLYDGSVVGNAAKLGELHHGHIYGGGVYFYNGSFIMYGGRIAENYSGRYGGGIACHRDKGTPKVIIKGGAIEGNICDASGGGAFLNGEIDFTMSGGVVQNNISHYLGGGLCIVQRSTAAILTGDAKILNNLAVNGGSANVPGDGGGVGGYQTNISITGNVEISGNKADDYGGGVGLWTYNNNYCSVTIGDSVQITDNYHNCDVTDDVATGGKTGNLWLDVNSEIILGTDDIAPKEGIKIGVSKANPANPLTKNTVTAGQEKYLFADDSEQSVVFDTGTNKLKLISGHKHDGKDFTKWEDATSLPTEGDYYLDTDVTLSAAWTIAADKTVHLDLNGHIVDLNKSHITVSSGAQLDVYDCKPEATHEGKTSLGGMITNGSGGANHAGAVYVQGTFNLHNGSLCNNIANGNQCCGGGVYVAANAVFSMYNGSFYSNTARKAGGAIANDGGTVNIYGGKIYSNNNLWPSTSGYNVGGAGIWTANGGTTTISGPLMLYDNHSGHGGAMKVVDGGIVVLDGVQIGLNTCVGYSGVLEAISGTASSVTYGNGRYHTLNTYSPAISGTSRIMLIKNGGNGGTDSVDAQAWGADLQAIEVPTRAGYNFLGYFNEDGEQYYNSDGTAFDKLGDSSTKTGNGCAYYDNNCAYYGNGTKWDYIGDVTLYAQWEKATHTHLGNPMVTFEEPIIDLAGLQALFENGGSGYLVENIEVPDRFVLLAGDVKLDLNGKNITFTGTATGSSAIELQNGCNFYLFDCSRGKILKSDTAGYTQAVKINANSTFYMRGGTISGFESTGNGGTVYVSGTMNMSDGTISDSSALNGGAISVSNSGSLLMSGGSIKDCAATGNGGGVYVDAGSTFTMIGGEISYNTSADNGGGVFDYGAIMLGGTAKIISNVKGGTIIDGVLSGGSANNFFICTDKTVTLGTGESVPKPDMSVYVTTQTAPTVSAPIVLTGDNGDDYSSYFSSDNSAYALKNVNNVLKLLHWGVITNSTSEEKKATNFGYISIDRQSALLNETVTITVVPNIAYTLKSLKYNDGIDDYDITGNSFVMPAADITVTAVFEHNHSFTYSVDGTDSYILKATCIAGCPDEYDLTPFKFTLTVPSTLTYSGTAKEAYFAEDEVTAWKNAIGLDVPTITYTAKDGSTLTDGKAVKAGSYTATATGDTDKSATLDFTITPATLTMDMSGVTVTKTYDKSNVATVSKGTLVGIVTADAGKVSVQDSVAATFNDANVGEGKAVTLTEDFVLSGDATENYTLTQPSGIIGSITAKNVAENRDAESQTVIIGDGSFVAPIFHDTVLNEDITGTLTYTYNSETKTKQEIEAVLATLSQGAMGSISYSYVADGNYTGTITGTINYTVEGILFKVAGETATAENAVTVKSDPTYGDAWNEIITIKSDDIDASVNSVAGSGTYTLNVSGTPNSGEQVYSVLFNGTVNDKTYTDVAVLSGTVIIAKAGWTVTAPMANSLYYTGADQILVSAGTVKGVNTSDSAAILYRLVGETDYSENIPTGKAVGTYQVEYKVAGNTNYNEYVGPSVVTVTIGQTQRTDIPTVSMSGYTYATDAVSGPSISLAKLDENPTVTYYVNSVADIAGAEAWANITSTTLDAGTYYMFALIGATESYGQCYTDFAQFEIAKADCTDVTAPIGLTLKYNGRPQNLVSAGASAQGTVMYRLAGEIDYSENIPTGKSVGTYKVEYKVAGTANYNEYTGSSPVTVTIGQTQRTDIPAVSMSGYKYGADAVPEPSITPAELAENPTVTYYYNAAAELAGAEVWEDITSTTLSAGTYYMFALIGATESYGQCYTEFAKFDIAKADPIIIINPQTTPAPAKEDAQSSDTQSEDAQSEGMTEGAAADAETPTEQTETPAEEYTAPVVEYDEQIEAGEAFVPVKAEVSDGIATVEEITEAELQNLVDEIMNAAAKTDDKETEGAADDSQKTEGGAADSKEADNSKGNEVTALTIDFSQATQDVTGVDLTAKTLEAISDVVNDESNPIESVKLELSEAIVELDAKTLEAVIEEAEGDIIRLVVEDTEVKNLNKSQSATIKSLAVDRTFEAYFESAGKRIHDFKGGNARVSLSFKPGKGKRVENYKVFYIDENGKHQKMTTKYENGLITFVTSHFSDYAVVYENVQDVLLTEASMTSKGNIRLTWNEIDGAVKYVVYGARCGKSYKKLAELDAATDGSAFTVKKINGAKPVSGKTYKFYVAAYDALGNRIKSKAIHFLAGNTSGECGNVETITALQKTFELNVGEKAVVGAEYTIFEDKERVSEKHGAALRFISDCPDVAKVAKDGTITAKGEGKAVIYIQDISGKWCRVEVTVKEK